MLGSAPVEPCSQPIFSFGLRSIAPGPDTSFAVLHRALFLRPVGGCELIWLDFRLKQMWKAGKYIEKPASEKKAMTW